MLNILINAYACNPNMGSEQGMGWNWVKHISEYCNVYVITESEYKKENDVALECNDILKNGNGTDNYKNHYGISLAQSKRIHFYFVPVGDNEHDSKKIRRMCWDQGNWWFYFKYAKWQKKAYYVAKHIIDELEAKNERIDVMHQLNMAGFREPGMLYYINVDRKKEKKSIIPIVWGPMTGYGSIPISFLIPGGIKYTFFYLLKNTLNYLELIGHIRVRKMIHASSYLIAATPEMKEGLESHYGVNVEQINETGCDDYFEHVAHRSFSIERSKPLKVLWVGRFIYSKQLPLALKTFEMLKGANVELHIIGKGFDDAVTDEMRRLAVQLNVDNMCHWYGQIAHEDVLRLMNESDVFFFTSLFEATSTVIMESIQMGLPIICFDRCGFGPIVDDSIGFKIPCESPKKAAQQFAKIIRYVDDNRTILPILSANCKKKQKILSWECKTKRIINIYRDVVYMCK